MAAKTETAKWKKEIIARIEKMEEHVFELKRGPQGYTGCNGNDGRDGRDGQDYRPKYLRFPVIKFSMVQYIPTVLGIAAIAFGGWSITSSVQETIAEKRDAYALGTHVCESKGGRVFNVNPNRTSANGLYCLIGDDVFELDRWSGLFTKTGVIETLDINN